MKMQGRKPGWAPLSVAAGYGVALAATMLSATCRWLLPGVLTPAPYLGFYPAVVVAAALGGVGPGIFATVVSMLLVNFVFGSFDLHDQSTLMRQLIWLAAGIGMSLLAGAQRDARIREGKQAEKLQQLNAELEIRSAQLEQTNTDLKQEMEKHKLAVDTLAERTAELEAANDLLRDSRLAALNMMEDAVVAGQYAEIVNTELRQEMLERQRAEEQAKQHLEELRQSEERLRLALTAGRMASWDWHIPSRAVVWNDMHFRMLGYEPGEIEPSYEAWANRVHPDDLARMEETVARHMAEHLLYTAEFRTLWPDGTIRWIEARGEFTYNVDGSPLRCYGVMLDITDRKEAEAALRQSRLDLDRAQEVGQIGWWRLDTVNNVLTWSDENYRIFGVTPGTPLSYESFLATLHPSDRDYVHERWTAALGGASYDIEHRIVANGTVKWVREKAYLEFAPSGALLGGFGITQDISERKRIELALQESKDNLERMVAERTSELADTVNALLIEIDEREKAEDTLQAETAERLRTLEELREKDRLLLQQSRLAAMGEMINNIAHQWRQPLNLLGMNVQKLLLFYDLGEFDRELLATSTEEAMVQIRHMSQTIDDFRTFFMADREKTDFNLLQALQKSVALINDTLKNDRIEVYMRVDDSITIHGFQNEFCQVIMNILQNARDELVGRRIPQGKITLTTAAERGKTVITIADNAGGIPADIIDRIFEPYFSTKGLQGTGIGLYMSKQIIESKMNGRLSACNGAHGAEFRIEI